MNQVSTSTNFAISLINQIIKETDDTKRLFFQKLWDVLMASLSDHWPVIILIFFVILLASFFKALFGRWGWFASVLYHYFYFGIFLIIGLIFGPQIFANTFIEILCAVIYLVCFAIVGVIINGFGFRK